MVRKLKKTSVVLRRAIDKESVKGKKLRRNLAREGKGIIKKTKKLRKETNKLLKRARKLQKKKL